MEEKHIFVFDRGENKIFQEKVFGEKILLYLYEKNNFIRCFCRSLVSKLSLISWLFGAWQKLPFTKRKVNPFIVKYKIDKTEFAKTTFSSFNDFFIRELKKESRLLASSDIIVPADGRYLAYQDFAQCKRLYVKGEKFSLYKLLGNDQKLADRYANGTLVIARLAPPDYHRFHFPLDCTASKPKLLNGPLFSVNPIALRTNIDYLTQNKRSIIHLRSKLYGEVICLAVGATNVGSMHFTYLENQLYKKGEEMGYFSFGGSMLIYLFEPGKIQIASDIVKYSSEGTEVLCKMGQPLTGLL